MTAAWLVSVIGSVACVAGCGFPRPRDVPGNDDGGVIGDPGCAANQSLRCDGDALIRCGSDGIAEVSNTCSLGCNSAALRCNDVAPSNGLAAYLDTATGEPDYDLGMNATINTDDGTVMADGVSIVVRSALVAQSSGPTMLVFIAHSLKANNVTASGKNAVVVVSNGEIQIGGVFAASAVGTTPGPGAFNDSACRGVGLVSVGNALGGAGGGAFGGSGGRGGSTTTTDGTAVGGAGGQPSGNVALTPLRGGCDSGGLNTGASGSGGGAIQLVSHARITVSGVLAANGSSFTGGGSGGGILLEAPTVEVTGTIAANGGAGGGVCLLPQPGEDGRLDATPAMGGPGCGTSRGPGGNGGAGAVAAADAANIIAASGSAAAGGGGGGVGRIRINALAGGFHRAGLFSPSPSTGAIGTR